MKRLMVGLVLIVLAVPSFGQSATFTELFSGKDFPFSLKLSQLNSDWRRLTVNSDAAGGTADMLGKLAQLGAMSDMGKGKGGSDAAGAMLGMQMLGGLFGGGDSKQPVYYTLGKTVTVGAESFLIAYKYQKPEVNLMQLAMESEKNGGKEPDFAKLAGGSKMTGDSVVSLSLINVKSLSSLGGIRPFDLAQEIADSEKGGGGLMDLIGMFAGREVSKPANVSVTATPVQKTPAKKAAPKK